MSPVDRVNDFVVKFANVNGSGSASANQLFAKSILRMGVPVSPRNIFPSNIQGLPTWYEIRISGKGWLGCSGRVDLMVAMNPQTWDKDVASIEPGGYLFYDSTKPLPPSKFRDDITVIGVPLTEMCNREYSDPRPAPAVQEHHLCRRAGGAARHRDRRGRDADRRAVQGQGQADPAELPCPPHGARLGAGEPRLPAAGAGPPHRRRRRPHLHRRQRRGGVRLALWRRHGVRLVPDHPVLLARRGVPALLPALPRRPGDQQEPFRRHPGRGRALVDRHGDRRRLERRRSPCRSTRARPRPG